MIRTLYTITMEPKNNLPQLYIAIIYNNFQKLWYSMRLLFYKSHLYFAVHSIVELYLLHRTI